MWNPRWPPQPQDSEHLDLQWCAERARDAALGVQGSMSLWVISSLMLRHPLCLCRWVTASPSRTQVPVSQVVWREGSVKEPSCVASSTKPTGAFQYSQLSTSAVRLLKSLVRAPSPSAVPMSARVCLCWYFAKGFVSRCSFYHAVLAKESVSSLQPSTAFLRSLHFAEDTTVTRGDRPCNNIDFVWVGKVQFVLNFQGKFG